MSPTNEGLNDRGKRRTHIHEMGRIEADEKGAAATAPTANLLPASGCHGLRGRKGLRCAATPIGPMPGPPPPCGMQKVLCRLRWHTSAPISAGEVRPHCAFMLAPSM